MKPTSILAAAVAAACLSLSVPAHADDLDLFVFGVLAEGIDIVGFGIADVIGSDRGIAYGAIETALNLPPAIALTYYAVAYSSSDRWLDAGLAVVNGALAAHGVYSIVHSLRSERTRGNERSAMMKIGSVRANLLPAAISAGRTMTAGIGLGGSF